MKNLFEQAKSALNNHQVIAFPTETVFGLGVYYDDEEAYHTNYLHYLLSHRYEPDSAFLYV